MSENPYHNQAVQSQNEPQGQSQTPNQLQTPNNEPHIQLDTSNEPSPALSKKKSSDKNVNVTEKSIKSSELHDKLGDAHMNILPKKKLIICLSALALSMVISFADQQGITVAMSEIGKDLNAETTINWAGTASLLANTVCQVLFGRMSDIFGRKQVLLSCLAILVISDVACGVARTGIQFFIFRAGAGIGNGGISSLGMVILSDIVSLKERGKYQGILGASVGVGNTVGPLIFAAFIKRGSWRYFYYWLAPFGCLVGFIMYMLIEDRQKELRSILSRKEKFKKIDYFGTLLSTSSITLLMVAVSGGGSSYPWGSALIITLFVVGGFLFICFLLCEWKIPQLPMVPLRLFKSPSLCCLLFSNFFFGMSYFSFMYYLPYYFQIIKLKDELHTAIFVIPLVMAQAVMSIVSGQIITRTGHYIYVVYVGYGLWLLACGLMLIWNRGTNDGVNVVILLIMGTGVGFTFQPTMVACQAQSKKADRAVVISTRNVLRSFGGAVGIAVASTTVSNTLLNKVKEMESHNPTDIPTHYLNYLKNHIYDKIQIDGLNDKQITAVRGMYLASLRNYYYLLIPFMAICLISSFFVRDRGLQCIDELPEPKKQDLESCATSITMTNKNSGEHELSKDDQFERRSFDDKTVGEKSRKESV
ncbi:MFS general substrate transporter [Hyphopichia burtonii NRRL Y-1933]|uniref:MFS general substrate transporter n=1 Tax=Hyphopichia burtonii NRRL Y-1933 TaxID=984485 RepID=A0A1E4RNX0_9ASCO|nr:MFS general substrate transporter [Hyphopichia burtonii NRRL Y-1933]ODV68957.1 MFS general substrate transporter [Hyphopichia burtonii NRRL Y-1933]